MKNFKWKSKRFIGSLITVVLIGMGVANPQLITPVLTEVVCNQVPCDA